MYSEEQCGEWKEHEDRSWFCHLATFGHLHNGMESQFLILRWGTNTKGNIKLHEITYLKVMVKILPVTRHKTHFNQV